MKKRGLSSCHYFVDEKRPYPYSQTFEDWEKTPQMGMEPVYYKDGRFYKRANLD